MNLFLSEVFVGVSAVVAEALVSEAIFYFISIAKQLTISNISDSCKATQIPTRQGIPQANSQ